MKILKATLLPLAVVVLSACNMTPVELPESVTTVGNTIDTIHTQFEYKGDAQNAFKKLHFCIADNMSNNSVELTGDSTYIGAYTGNLYTHQNKSYEAGGNLFKFVDESLLKMVVEGNHDYTATLLGMPEERNYRYKLVASLDNGIAKLDYSDLGRAYKSSGLVDNRGYDPVYTHAGAKPYEFISIVESMTNKIEVCHAE